MGFDARAFTPLMVQRGVVSVAETRSFVRAALVMREVGGQAMSAKTLQRLSGEVGRELAQRREQPAGASDGLARRPADPPALAVVECDGGRIRTREPGHGRGVHRSGEGWRETKAACLQSAHQETFASDPQPHPPECFCDPEHVAQIAETEALSLAAPPAAEEAAVDSADEQPEPPPRPARIRRVVRTVLCSMACSKDFGRQMKREARRRRFFEAAERAFLGDGLPWNWSIHKQQFPTFVPILDFIHALAYVYAAAKAVHHDPQDIWDQYLAWMRGCWQGEVAQVVAELEVWSSQLGPPPQDAPDSDPRQIVATSLGYLQNNAPRMNYPDDRRRGLPVTTAWMESLVKQINYRVKGTEMFWNDPHGAEAILQIRAAALSEDDRLKSHLQTRPGSPFTRRPTSAKPPAQKYIC